VTRSRQAGIAALTVGLLLALPGAAGAYTTASGYAAQDYATGFPESSTNDWGPIGIAFDLSDNMYVADNVDGNIYKFQPGGGVASSDTQLTSSPIPGGIEGLVASADGELYLARYSTGDIVQVDPDTGDVLRTVASVPCATGLAIDPVSGDLFVSENQCGSTIFRISGYQDGTGTVSSYARAGGVDGLAFDQDGTLYAESDGNVLKIAGTLSPTPGLVTSVAHVPGADGLAFGAHSSGRLPYLVANRNDGIVTKVNFSSAFPSQTDIFSGGSRGDFVAVDSNGCLYITQSNSIVRISSASDTCGLEPSNPGAAPPAQVVVTPVGHTRHTGPACTRIRSLRLRVHQQGRVRLRSATVYVNGKAVKRLNGAKVTAPFVLTHLPSSSFTVKVVAVTTTGKRLVTSTYYANCARPTPAGCGSKLVVNVPQRKGDPATLVYAYVNGKRVSVVHGRAITRITLTKLPRGAFTVALITHYARGRPATTRKTYAGCSGH
jgi:sugar lactone lactonase YvrE